MTEKQYFTLLNLMKGINQQISHINTHPICQSWLTKTQVKKIFGYSENSLRNIEQFLELSRIRARKFYSTKSVLKFIESGLVNTERSEEPKSNSL